jgi:hypothetical protein
MRLELIDELADVSDEDANRILDVLETEVDDELAARIVNVLAEHAGWKRRDPEAIAAQLAALVSFVELRLGSDPTRFDLMLRMIRAGHKASFRLGMSGRTTPVA